MDDLEIWSGKRCGVSREWPYNNGTSVSHRLPYNNRSL